MFSLNRRKALTCLDTSKDDPMDMIGLLFRFSSLEPIGTVVVQWDYVCTVYEESK